MSSTYSALEYYDPKIDWSLPKGLLHSTLTSGLPTYPQLGPLLSFFPVRSSLPSYRSLSVPSLLCSWFSSGPTYPLTLPTPTPSPSHHYDLPHPPRSPSPVLGFPKQSEQFPMTRQYKKPKNEYSTHWNPIS